MMDADSASGVITYTDPDNKNAEYKFDIKTLVAPEEPGFCLSAKENQTIEKLVFSFYPNDITPNITDKAWDLSIIFAQKPESTKADYEISSYTLNAIIYDDMFPRMNRTEYSFTKSDKAELEWKGEEDLGFQCSSSGLSFTHDASINFSNLKVVAFGSLDDDKFPSDQRFNMCQLDIRTSDLVPIVVGACLAGLVIIVLIAYLIGRARAKRQGYASV